MRQQLRVGEPGGVALPHALESAARKHQGVGGGGRGLRGPVLDWQEGQPQKGREKAALAHEKEKERQAKKRARQKAKKAEEKAKLEEEKKKQEEEEAKKLAAGHHGKDVWQRFEAQIESAL